MSEALEHNLDKSDWGDGPWQREPDKLNWRTRAGMPGMIVRNPAGALCGYVAVNPGHPLYGKQYSELEVDLDVHGGLTYSDACQGVICHVPEPGEPDNVWWFGFDCHHSHDFGPAFHVRTREIRESVRRNMEARYGRALGPMPDEDARNYKTVDYVKREVESLAEQLAAVTVETARA